MFMSMTCINNLHKHKGRKLNDEGDTNKRQTSLLLECKGNNTKATCCGATKEFRLKETLVHS